MITYFRRADHSLPAFLVKKEADHLAWTGTVQSAILAGASKIEVQFDPTKCSFGNFLYGEGGQKLSHADSTSRTRSGNSARR